MFLTNQHLTEQAQIAAQQNNWSFVTECLHQLLQSNQKIGQYSGSVQPRISKNAVKLTSQKLHHPQPDFSSKQEPKFLLDLALQVLEFGDFQERWEIAKVLPSLGNEAIAPLMEILQDEEADWELRWFTGQIISQFDRPEVINLLMDLVNDGTDEELSVMAAEALASIGPGAIDSLRELLNNDSSRLLAVRALAAIHHPEIIDSLLTVVNDPQGLVRTTAIAALSNFEDPRILPVSIAALADPLSSVRREATIGLGLYSMRTGSDSLPNQHHNLVDLLRARLWDVNLDVCQQAAIALMQVGTAGAATALFEVLKQPTTPVPLAVTVVHRLARISHPISLDYLQQALTFPFSSEVYRETIVALGRVEHPALTPQAAHILIDLLQGKIPLPVVEQPQIKQAIAIGLGQLGQSQAIDSLTQLLSDPDETVRLHAIAALKHFDSSVSGSIE